MSVILRLKRMGAKNKPVYRIVAIDSRKKRDGEYLESLGNYDPARTEDHSQIKKERVDYWINQGAAVSDTVRSILKKHGVFRPAVAAVAGETN